ASAGRLLGAWEIEVEEWNGYSTVQVEEYKRPTFEVEIDEPTAALRLNREARVTGRAGYYFGLPVSAGTARWRISREPRYPRWRWWLPPGPTSSQVIAHGESPLGVDGTFEIVFTPEADERLADQRDIAYRYRIQADVTDDGGETRDGQRSVTVGFAAIDASLEAAAPSFAADRPVVFDVSRTRLSGPAAPGPGSFRVVRLEQPDRTPLPSELPADPDARGEDAFRTAGDSLRPRWSPETDPRRFLRQLPEGPEVASGGLTHGDDGRARVEVELPGGAYRIHYRSDDEFGETVERHSDFWVRGDSPLRLPLVLASAVREVEVGESLALVVHSGFAGQRLVLDVENRKRRVLRREIEAASRPQVIEVPITPAERGGVSVTLTAVRDHQWMRREQRVDVPWTDRRLDVRFERFRDRLRPGAEESFSVVVSVPEDADATLDPGAVELLAYMYDRSLDLFARHSPVNVASLYPGHSGPAPARSNLGQAPIVWQRYTLPRPPAVPNLRPASLRYLDGWPIGGPGQRRARLQSLKARPMMARAAPAPAPPAPDGLSEEITVTDSMPEAEVASAVSMAASPAEPPPSDGPGDPDGAEAQPVRSDFAETAFWLPHLRLDADGAARLEFTVPDSVTEWNVWAHALTRDLRGGSATKTTRSVKDLLIRPYLPRFLRAGDRADRREVRRRIDDEIADQRIPGAGAEVHVDLVLRQRPVVDRDEVETAEPGPVVTDLVAQGEAEVRVPVHERALDRRRGLELAVDEDAT
ncbi:MAG: alpha-2-macroglobulin family protein, partial [Acidobacteriota bacterium]